jgi:hypothetical protein
MIKENQIIISDSIHKIKSIITADPCLALPHKNIDTCYSTYDKKLLAIKDALKHWRYHLLGRKTKITIDHISVEISSFNTLSLDTSVFHF